MLALQIRWRMMVSLAPLTFLTHPTLMTNTSVRCVAANASARRMIDAIRDRPLLLLVDLTLTTIGGPYGQLQAGSR